MSVIQLSNGALYIRVSTHDQEDLSPDAQKRLLLDYAKKNNIIISKERIFIEGGISGRKADKRPEFQNMIAQAKSKEHPFDIILVWKYSRFARNQEESIVYKSMLSKDHVDVISISEPIIDGPFGSLIERIIEWMDEYYSIRLSGEVIRGMTEKALRGGYQATTPIGYNYNKSSNVPVINDAEAKIVKLIYSQYLAGSDFSTIARNMNDFGFHTKRGNPFELRVIKYILRNPFYIGKIRWNRAKHSSYIENSSEEIIISDAHHESIISNEDFYAVQERIDKEFRPGRRKGIGFTKHWLCGLLKCGYCGAALTYSKGKAISGNFQCYKYAKGLHDESCGISEIKAVNNILDILKNSIQTQDFKLNYFSSSFSSHVDTAIYDKQLENISLKEKRIKAAYADGIDTLEEYKENKNLLNKERTSILQKINNVSISAPVDPEIIKSKILDRCKSVYDVLLSNANNEIKASAIRSICESITYFKETKEFELIFYLS